MSELGLLTQSRLSAMRTCQRMHNIKYVLGYRAVVELGGRKFGTLMHAGLEAWWLAKQRDENEASCLERALDALTQLESDEFELAKAMVLIHGYHARWKDELYKVVGVETEFRTTLRNPATGAASRTWELGGKLDVLVIDLKDGQKKFVEHKTSAENIEFGSAYWKRLRMDGQVSQYFEGAKSLGHESTECVYDVIGKPALRPYKATPMESRKFKANGELYANQRAEDETPDEYSARLTEAVAEAPERYFARGAVVRLESEMEGALVDIWQLGQQIRESELAGRAPKNPGACVQFGRECDFFAICCGEASLDDPSLFEKLESIHPELSVTTSKEDKAL